MFLPFTVANIRCLKRGSPTKKCKKSGDQGASWGPGLEITIPVQAASLGSPSTYWRESPLAQCLSPFGFVWAVLWKFFFKNPWRFNVPFYKGGNSERHPLWHRIPDGKGDSAYLHRKDSAQRRKFFWGGKTFEISKQQTN